MSNDTTTRRQEAIDRAERALAREKARAAVELRVLDALPPAAGNPHMIHPSSLYGATATVAYEGDPDPYVRNGVDAARVIDLMRALPPVACLHFRDGATYCTPAEHERARGVVAACDADPELTRKHRPVDLTWWLRVERFGQAAQRTYDKVSVHWYTRIGGLLLHVSCTVNPSAWRGVIEISQDWTTHGRGRRRSGVCVGAPGARRDLRWCKYWSSDPRWCASFLVHAYDGEAFESVWPELCGGAP